MPFFLDTQEIVQRFGSYVAEVDSLLETDHVRHGSPDDLFEFARTLDSSNQFRLDLSTLVKSVVKRSNEEVLLTDMMSIIATSVGGPSIAETHADITKPTNTLMEFLLGTGCWRQFGLPSRPTSSNAVLQAPKPIPHTETEPVPIRIPLPDSHISKDSSAPKANEHLEGQPSLLDVSNELRQTLSRLESSAEQVKLHLDSIERRIGKIKPQSETPPAKASSGLEPLLYRGFEETVDDKKAVPSLEEDEPIFGARPAASNRAVFSPPEPRVSQEEDYDFSAPTFAYGSEKERSMIPLGVLLVVLLAILVGGAFYAFSGQGRTLLKAGLSRFPNTRTHFANAPTPVNPAPTTTPSPASTPASPASVETSTAPSPATQPSPAKTEDGIPTPPTASEAAAPSDAQVAQVSSGNGKYRYVSANVMEGYLLSAPRPEYPSQARLAHIEGQVAMQATISRSGSIVTLHVTNGPSSLRSAAIDAVRSWRYRPYVVNGQAVPVATTVYVDFNLRPPPSIVH